jgi:elongation factor Ts
MSLDLIKKLREKTGLPLKDIKKAVESMSDKSEDEIIEHLRKQGLLKQGSRSDRSTTQGRIFSYVHEGRIGVLLEIKCETDFVARSDQFIEFGDDLCLHIAAYRPLYVKGEDAPIEFVEKEIEIAKSQLLQENKPPEIMEKILAGKKAKILEENSLLSQQFLKDPKIKIFEKLADVSQATAEKIEVTRFEIFSI